VQSLQVFYAELTTRHNGRFPKYDRTAWQIVNAIAAGTKSVSLTEVAKTLGVNVNHLYHGKKRWTSWLNYDYEDDGPARCLKDYEL
jgi:hypothetical protein